MEDRKPIYLGRIKYTIARLAHIKCADITVDYNHLVHIGRQHIKDKDNWQVRTAQPRRDVSKDKLLWKKKEAE